MHRYTMHTHAPHPSVGWPKAEIVTMEGIPSRPPASCLEGHSEVQPVCGENREKGTELDLENCRGEQLLPGKLSRTQNRWVSLQMDLHLRLMYVLTAGP